MCSRNCSNLELCFECCICCSIKWMTFWKYWECVYWHSSRTLEDVELKVASGHLVCEVWVLVAFSSCNDWFWMGYILNCSVTARDGSPLQCIFWLCREANLLLMVHATEQGEAQVLQTLVEPHLYSLHPISPHRKIWKLWRKVASIQGQAQLWPTTVIMLSPRMHESGSLFLSPHSYELTISVGLLIRLCYTKMM